MKRLLSICLLTVASASFSSAAQANQNSSEMSIQGSGMVLVGSMSALAGSGVLVVASVKGVADGVVVVVKGASNGVEASIKLSGKAAEGLSVATGTVVSVVAISTGHMLVLSGKVLAFIPNEIGKSLLHHSRVDASAV